MEHLLLGFGGNWSALCDSTFDELFVPFPDFIQEAAAVNENNLQVEGKKATLVVEAEANGEMYVLEQFLYIFANILSS